MDNNGRDKVLLTISKDVGEIKGTVSGYETRLAALESGKVGWRTFSSIQAFFLAAAGTAVAIFGRNP